MRYAVLKKQGLPIGSGVTEAACKTLATQRLKKVGGEPKTGHGANTREILVIELSVLLHELVGDAVVEILKRLVVRILSQ